MNDIVYKKFSECIISRVGKGVDMTLWRMFNCTSNNFVCLYIFSFFYSLPGFLIFSRPQRLSDEVRGVQSTPKSIKTNPLPFLRTLPPFITFLFPSPSRLDGLGERRIISFYNRRRYLNI